MVVVITKIVGAKELADDVSKLKKKVANKLLRKSMRRESKVLQSQAKAKAPKESGDLKKSIKVRAMKRKRNRIGMRVTSKLPYSMAKEYGFKHYRSGRDVIGDEYMQKAAAIEETKVRRRIANDVKEAVREQFGH